VDADGDTLHLDGPARRIVSLVPSATLTLDALGARDRLVARTDFDATPWAGELPSVGGGLEPSLEAIVAVQPDLVIRFGGPQDPRTPARLDEVGISHLAIRPDRIADVLEEIRVLGAVTGRDDEAGRLVGAIRDTLDAIRGRSADRVPVRVAYVLGGAPPWVAGPGTYIDELITLAGGVNVFADLGELYGSVSPEEFVAREIDVVMTPRGSRFDRHLVAGARFVEVGPAMELPGPGVTDAAREMERALRGGGAP
jgi:iron complex transport system substrate-binding protein